MRNRRALGACALALALAAAAAAEPAYYALLVGVNEYKDPAILTLASPRNDAKTVGEVLERSGWDLVLTMTDDRDFRSKERLFPDKDNIEHRVSLLAELMSPEDVAFIFFSGHGLRSAKGEALLLPFDANRERLAESSISVEWIEDRFRARGLRKVFFALDACRENLSGAKGLAVVGVAAGQPSLAAAPGAIEYPILYSTQAGGFSYETSDGPEARSLFARFLAEGLKAPAADPERRDLDWAGLCESVMREASRYALQKGLNQKPDFYLPPGAEAGTVFVRAGRAAASAGGEPVYGGIGTAIRKSGGVMFVESVFPLSPADMAGLVRGDRLLSVNGMDVSGYSTEQVSEKIRGLAGTQVKLKVQREKDGSVVDLGLTRSTITRQSLVLQEAQDGLPSVAAIVMAPVVRRYDPDSKAWLPTSRVSRKSTKAISYSFWLDWPARPARSVLSDFALLERSPNGKERKLRPVEGKSGFEKDAELSLGFLVEAKDLARLEPGEHVIEALYRGRLLASTKYWISD